ncbi:hypothetical protein NH26_10390 [Flammeovirga pacifica]|uniref:Uncharacterized protein n=2 Tax=Flammeovirga pacifica TaxID=915059 RepID=A0A1S1Z0G9_FLAPC|nr:hypothetical protein NH26_10390 [Flammeovirga pacifica]
MYVVTHYLNSQLPFVFACIGAVILSILSHYYISIGVKEMTNFKTLTSSFVIGGVLVSSIFFCEFKGVEIVTHETMVNTSKVESISNQLGVFRTQLGEVSLKRDWRSIEQKRTIEKQIKDLGVVLHEEKEKVNQATLKASERSNEFRFFSIVLVALSMLASSCISNGLETVSETVSKTVKQAKLNEFEALAKPLDKPFNLLDSTERIRLASDYIRTTNEAPHNVLMKKFKLSPKQVKEAKILAGYTLKEEGQKVIGF